MQLNIEKQLFKGFVRTEESLKNAAKAKYFLTIFTFTPVMAWDLTQFRSFLIIENDKSFE